MNSDTTIRKLVQVAEQAQMPIHVPVVLGNECFIVTQQDVRKIEDSRVFTYSKVNAKGEIVPMDMNMPDANMREALLTATRYQTQLHHQNAMSPLNMNAFTDLMARTCGTNPPQSSNMFQTTTPEVVQCFPTGVVQTTPVTPTITFAPSAPPGYTAALATLQQQLDWARASPNTLTPTQNPLHHTLATSTTEISHMPCSQQQKRDCCTRACNTMEVDEQKPAETRSTTNLCARHQAKQRKMTHFAS